MRGSLALPSRGGGSGEISPRSPSAHPDGRWGCWLLWQEHCQAPPKSSLLQESLPCLRAAVLGGTSLCSARIRPFPVERPAPRAGVVLLEAETLPLPASIRIGARGESGRTFPTRFPTLRGKKEKESHDLELPERQRGERVTQGAKNLLRCRVSFLLCGAGLGEVGLREARKGDGAG